MRKAPVTITCVTTRTEPFTAQPPTLDGLAAPVPARRTRRARPAAKAATTWSLVAFGAAWCAPWPLLHPVLEQIDADGVPVEFVDVDRDAAAAERYRVVTLPTLVVLRDGTERRRITGAVSAGELRGFVGLR